MSQWGWGGVIRIYSDGYDQRFFLGLKVSFQDFSGEENLSSIFLGGLI